MRYFTEDHSFADTDIPHGDWEDGKTPLVAIGITEDGHELLDDVVYYSHDVAKEGDVVKAGQPILTLESNKMVHDISMPFDSKVVRFNHDLEDAEGVAMINRNPDHVWMAIIQPLSVSLDMLGTVMLEEEGF